MIQLHLLSDIVRSHGFLQLLHNRHFVRQTHDLKPFRNDLLQLCQLLAVLFLVDERVDVRLLQLFVHFLPLDRGLVFCFKQVEDCFCQSNLVVNLAAGIWRLYQVWSAFATLAFDTLHRLYPLNGLLGYTTLRQLHWHFIRIFVHTVSIAQQVIACVY